ncbi:MAG TPA: VacJ family lipoprotein [Stellaceae bacterium]|nr:VacJ family lipoprotein [Stellaceae bacterium]
MHRRIAAHALLGSALTAVLAVVLLLGARAAHAQQTAQAAATAAAADVDDNGDPWENTNRAIFGFNQAVDRTVLVPVANTYRAVLPTPFRDMVHDFLQNLNSPIIFANDVLQGEANLAGDTFSRAMINTTIGFGGIVDVATKLGIPYHTNDLGITFATWGVASGPYLMLPVLGPSNPRDLVGDVGDSFGDPGNIVASDHNRIWASIVRSTVSGVDERSRNIENLAEIERTSLDYYATIRSLARQRRAAQIRHQKEDVPNASPLQGASAAPVPGPSIAALPPAAKPAISYQMAPQAPRVNSLADLQRSPMVPSSAGNR